MKKRHLINFIAILVLLLGSSVNQTKAADVIVTFKANGGFGNDYVQTIENNTPTTLTELARIGFYKNDENDVPFGFVEWRTNEDGSGTIYADGQSVTLTNDLTLYAVWRQVTVTFNPYDGNGEPYTQKVPYNFPTSLAPNTFAHDVVDGNQYYFLAWHTKNAESGGDYYGDQESVTLTSDLTLYARWYHTGMHYYYIWSSAPEAGAFYTSAYIRVDADLTLKDEIIVSGSPANVTVVDLNGHTLTAKANKRLFKVVGSEGKGVILIITDTSPNKSGKIVGGTADVGGGIYVENARLVMNAGQIIKCQATQQPTYPETGDPTNVDTGGGAIYVDNGVFTLNGGTIGGNPSALSCSGATATEATLSFASTNKNSAYEGSAVFAKGGLFHMHGGSIIGNEATSYKYSNPNDYATAVTANHVNTGGAVYVSGRMVMDGGTISKNLQAGGAIVVEASNDEVARLDFVGGKVDSNLAFCYNNAGNFGNGGGLFIYGKKVDDVVYLCKANISRNAEISNNIAVRNGGGIHQHSNSVLNITGGSIINNKAMFQLGGGMIVDDSNSDENTQPLLKNCKWEGNEAGTDGGAIYARHPVTLAEGVVIVNNKANRDGGGIFVYHTNGIDIAANGPIKVEYNTGIAEGIEVFENVFLKKDSGIINVKKGFTPQYLGIYTDNASEVPIPVFSGSASLLLPIYNGMIGNGSTINVFDDKQLYTASYTSGDEVLYFGTGSPWSPLQKTVNSLPAYDANNGGYQIGSVKELTAFLWYVNHITTHHTFDDYTHPNVDGVLTDDIDMSGHYWVPINDYSGTFDGNGHCISNLTMAPTNVSAKRGMFGNTSGATIKNLVLNNCSFGISGTSNIAFLGAVVSEMNGGTVMNCFVNGSLSSALETCVIGGLVGKVYGNGEVHSCASTPTITGKEMAGMVGYIMAGSSLKNSFSNPFINYTSEDKIAGDYYYVSALVAKNLGLIENCYARLQGASLSASFLAYPSHKVLVGRNAESTSNGTIKYLYKSNVSSEFNWFIDEGFTGSITAHCRFTDTETPYLYKHADNQVSKVRTEDVHKYLDNEANKQMVKVLNNWVTAMNKAGGEYSYWFRPTTKIINNDYPILRFPKTNAVAASNGGANLEYGDVNSLLNEYTTNTDAVCLFGQKERMNGNASSSASLYIDQEATLKQSGLGGAINAYVGITLQNNPLPEYQWHMFSTPLQNVPLGINYTDNAEYPFSWGYCENMPYYQFYDDAAHRGYFPSHVYGTTYSQTQTLGGCNYYSEWDYYSYSEPDYHWINFKRNSNSHWHEDDEGTTKINYTNETFLPKGKGYFLATKEDTHLQAFGTLNDGMLNGSIENIYKATVTEDISWTSRQGFNLVGNPYQSYLDFVRFAEANNSLWNNDATQAYYYVIDGNEYKKYAYDASANPLTAPRLLHPHQGFFIVAKTADAGGTALIFNNDMRTVKGEEVAFRGSEQPAYPLVNLIATDSDGKRDIATVELNRPAKGGAKVIRNMLLSRGIIYCHYEGEDYAIAFTRPGLTEAAIRFETAEDDTYTLTWDTENGDFSYLHLIDNLTGADIDCLSAREYRFTSKTTDYSSRFRLMFDYTSIEEPESDGSGEELVNFAFQLDDELVVNGEGQLQLFDLSGRLLADWRTRGVQSTVHLPQVAQGVYLLRLSDNNGARIQKIVIQ